MTVEFVQFITRRNLTPFTEPRRLHVLRKWLLHRKKILCYLICEEQFCEKCTTRVSKKLQVRLLITYCHLHLV
jgi:hypothetical protein